MTVDNFWGFYAIILGRLFMNTARIRATCPLRFAFEDSAVGCCCCTASSIESTGFSRPSTPVSGALAAAAAVALVLLLAPCT